MAYSEPGSGLSGAQERKADASERMKKSMFADADSRSDNAIALRREFLENQALLKAEYEAMRPRPRDPRG